MIMLIMVGTACGQRQQPSSVTRAADIQKRLTGTWTKEMNLDDGGQYRSVTVYRPEGNCAGEGTIVRSNETSQFSEAGTFLVRGGVLILTTMTKHSSTNARVPLVERDHVVRLDERELVLQSEERPDLAAVTSRREK